ncbi:hypothetical protein [Nitrosomonas marina]|uniref:Prepilin-type processing-associated H-X9-DG domain-containing protein n=1 Tax=Nitrosomonas marina TaxID=917 RepID=A0A1H8AIQ2_9PROT|nr:hypothetical protein [Nitrosomonas marina]SEM70501.1 hypothetical protein SAMN05216325_101165 [Nitrosomonas marina]
MKQRLKNLIQLICSLVLIAHTHFVAAENTASDTDNVLNWAENTYPALFPGHKATQSIDPWLFRFYPETGIYAGVNVNDNNVYVLGGPWNTATAVDTLPNLVSFIQNSGGNTSISACNTTNVPDGIFYSQSGNVVTVTTNGQCIPAPDMNDPTSSNLCVTPHQTEASGVSVLSNNTITSSSLNGITTTIPGLPNPFKSIVDAGASVKHCTINAAPDSTNLVVNSDICFDITDSLSGALSSFPIDGIQVTPPITYSSSGTYSGQVVADCFTTDATTISDAFTGEVWVRQNNTFVKIAN